MSAFAATRKRLVASVKTHILRPRRVRVFPDPDVKEGTPFI
jgi:hypothetical protein